jgi:hypothetical protein
MATSKAFDGFAALHNHEPPLSVGYFGPALPAVIDAP